MTAYKDGTGSGLQGHFLLAMPGLSGDFFANSITYLCEHSQHGAMGIVVNQLLDLNLEEVLAHLELPTSGLFQDTAVLSGGPVQTDRGFILHPPQTDEWEATLSISDDIALTTSQDILASIATGEGPQRYLVALGYAGWSPGQLESEIAANAWLTLPADADILFETPLHLRLSKAAAQLGVDMNLLSAQAGRA